MGTGTSPGQQVLTWDKSGFGSRHNQPKPTARAAVVKTSHLLERTYSAFTFTDDWDWIRPGTESNQAETELLLDFCSLGLLFSQSFWISVRALLPASQSMWQDLCVHPELRHLQKDLCTSIKILSNISGWSPTPPHWIFCALRTVARNCGIRPGGLKGQMPKFRLVQANLRAALSEGRRDVLYCCTAEYTRVDHLPAEWT